MISVCVLEWNDCELSFVSFGCRQLCLGVWQHVAFSASIQKTFEDSSVFIIFHSHPLSSCTSSFLPGTFASIHHAPQPQWPRAIYSSMLDSTYVSLHIWLHLLTRIHKPMCVILSRQHLGIFIKPMLKILYLRMSEWGTINSAGSSIWGYTKLSSSCIETWRIGEIGEQQRQHIQHKIISPHSSPEVRGWIHVVSLRAAANPCYRANV